MFLKKSCLSLALILASGVFCASPAFSASGEKALVVTPDSRATQAALEVLKEGGNAVDAAVTAQWVLNVVAPQSSGIGGGGLILFYDIGTKRILSFDGSVKAPARASPRMFLDASGKLLPYHPDRNTGGLSAGVPGVLKLAEEIHAKYGTRKFPFPKLFDPAIRYAEEGASVSGELAEALRKNKERLELLDPEKTVFFENGEPLKEGQRVFQPELGKTFRLIQSRGTASFYKGAIASAIERTVRKSPYQPGLLRGKDLESYTVVARSPLYLTYQGYDLFTAGPPSSGGLMLFRALNILSHFGIPGLGQTPETYHLLAETQKAAFLDRASVADPDLFDVPTQELLSEAWAQDRAGAIRFDQILKTDEPLAGDPEQEKSRDGSSILIADPQGNIVILFATLGDSFGSALRVKEYGFFLNDLLADLAADPERVKDPDSPERISGGQRPRGAEAPVFVFKNGKPAFAASAYGAEDPAAILFNVLVQKIDLGESCVGAVEFPRILSRGRELFLESALYQAENAKTKLKLLGHDLQEKDPLGTAQMICFEEGSGKISGEADSRGDGEAAGF